MSRWLKRALAPMRVATTNVIAVLDSENVVGRSDLVGQVVSITEWWQLRAAFELAGRRRPAYLPHLLLHVSGALASQPLPWDIEQDATTVVVHLPGGPSVRAALAELGGEEADRAIAAVETSRGNAAVAVLRSVTGIGGSGALLTLDEQLRVVAMLATRVHRGALTNLARSVITESVLAALLSVPSDTGALQARWDAFARGEESAWAAAFEAARLELGQLFATGLLRPIVSTAALPGWATIGVRSITDEERARELLGNPPVPWPPVNAAGWCAAAVWWGSVRSLTAGAPDELRESAWQCWDELDGYFLPWLRAYFSSVVSSAARWPSTVNHVAPYLARRLRDGDAKRLLLVVLDGLGHTQWQFLKSRLSLRVVTDGSTFAMLPTYTTVSRQAIFAGALPVTFGDSLWTTHRERGKWEAFWAEQGVADVAYHRLIGRLPYDVLEFGESRVVGVVLNAVDDLMHGSELLGDAQLLANVAVWASHGYLDSLVRNATLHGFETWITADHGNLECRPAGSRSEGLGIDAAGKRLLRYPNRTLRDASATDGIVWDGIPGLPLTAEPLRFAPGRLAYTNNALSISHGGLSLDEVIVPLARVEA